MGQTKYEYHDTGDTSSSPIGGNAWYAQSFTPSTGHDVFRVKILASGTTGQTLNVEIRSTDGNGHPDTVLCSGTYNTDNLDPSTPAWHTIDMDTDYTLVASTKYAIVCHQTSGTTNWRWEQVGSYAGGNGITSTDAGASWTNATVDLMFEEWGRGPHTLTVNTTGTGTVAEDPDQATHTHNSTVDLTATAGGGWSFDSWSGDMTGSTNPDTITMDDDKTVTATFTEDPITKSQGVFVG